MIQSSLSPSSSASATHCSSLPAGSSCRNSPESTSLSAMQKRPESNHGELDRPKHYPNFVAAAAQGDGNLCKLARPSSLSKCNRSTISSFSSLSRTKLYHMFEANPNPETSLEPKPMIPSPEHNCMVYPDCRVDSELFLEEGQGECDGDRMSSISRSTTPWDTSGDTNMVSLRRRRPSPTAASCFCKDIEEEQEYFQQVLGSSSHGWTDEKHSSYLDSMEADFLRRVMFKGSSVLQVEESSSELDDCASSLQAKTAKQFKVCQNGRWRPVCVQAPYANMGPLKQLAVAVKNPWIKRFRASKRTYFPSLIMEDPLLEDVKARCKSSHRQE